MHRISPSRIGMLLECPRCLWLYFREDTKRPSGPFPSLPSGMDNVLKDYFDEHRAAGELPPEIDGKVEGNLFQDRKKLDVWRNNWKGLVAEFPEYDMKLKGAIDDLLETSDGKVTPFDFKTRGYPIKDNSHTYYYDQLNLYALLLQENGMETSGKGYLLFFWPTDYSLGGAQFASAVVEMTAEPKAGKEVLERAHEIIKGKKPSAHSECEFCLYRADGVVEQDTLL